MQVFFGKVLRFIRRPSFLAFVYFTFMTLVMTYPLIFRMNQIVGDPGSDGMYFFWLVRWHQKALFELKISPFFDPSLNYPQGWQLASTDITPAMVALALPGSLLFGLIWACMVERHLTLDRSVSVEPGGFERLVKYIRVAEDSLGDGVKHVCENEKPWLKKFRRVFSEKS